MRVFMALLDIVAPDGREPSVLRQRLRLIVNGSLRSLVCGGLTTLPAGLIPS